MEYRRFLSYLYLYEHHRKKNCIGFVKAEQKAGEIRLTIQIEEERRMDGRKLSICFYKPDVGKEGSFKKYILDEMVLEWKKTDFYKNYPISMLPEDFHLEEQHGILLLSQDHFYYGSVWKGNEIPLELFEKENQDKNTVEVTEPQVDKDELGEKEPDDSKKKSEDFNMESEDNLPELKENAAGEKASEDYLEEEKKENQIEKEALAPENVKKESEDEISESKKHMEVSEDKINEPDEKDSELEILSQPVKEDSLVFQEGNRISVKQLRSRPGEKNRYSNNPFLLQSYQKYGHILEGKIRYHGEDCDFIGVPGIYGNREKYMAEMYHFPVFLCLSDKKTKTGEFGYWIHMIQ